MRQKKLGVALAMGLAVLFGVGAVLGTIWFWQSQAINSTFQVALADGERWTGEGQEAALESVNQRLAVLQTKIKAETPVALNQTATGFRVTFPETVSQTTVLPLLTWVGEVTVIDGGIEFPPVSLDTPIEVGPVAQPEAGVYGVVITQGDVIEATELPDSATETGFGLRLRLSETAYARYSEFISRNQGVYLCVVVDNYVVACPVMRPAERVDPAAQQAVDMLPGPTDILLDETLLLALLTSSPLPSELELVE